METLIIGIDGMSCGGCVASVESAIGRLPGIKKVRADLEKKQATVEGEALDRTRIAAAVEDAGFEVRT